MQSQPQPQLAALIKGTMFEGFLLVRASEQRSAQNGSKYLDMTLVDVSGEVNAKMWDGAVQPPKAGAVVKIRGMMQEYNNRPQMRVDKLRPADDRDNYDMNALVPCAPEPPEAMMEQLMARAGAIADQELRAVVALRLEQAGDKLRYYPAAQKLHHAERSGLLHHVTTMLRAADAICAIYPQLDADLVAAGVMLHDLNKLTEMRADATGVVDDYTAEGLLLGHLVTGVGEIERACEQVGAREELKLMLCHMVLAHHDLPEYGSPRRPMFPEAEVLHIVDLLDARMFEMTRSLSGALPGAFTERI
ncbi:MAG: HD domain-containing protein, partial [Clostridiales bacterium]|nr:HD domain-containing protein [Clostridiales bacterium]